MKFTAHHLLATIVLAGVAAVAGAQPGPSAQPPGPGSAPPTVQRGPGMDAPRTHDGMREGHHGMREAHHGMRGQFMARRLARLKETLRITPAQEGSWSTYASALRPAPRQRPELGEMARLTTPERVDRMRALRSQRMAEADRRGEATKSFYASLSAEQKRVFDQVTLRHGGREGGGHERHHRG